MIQSLPWGTKMPPPKFMQMMQSAKVIYCLLFSDSLYSARTFLNGSACSPCQAGYFCTNSSFNARGAVDGQGMGFLRVHPLTCFELFSSIVYSCFTLSQSW